VLGLIWRESALDDLEAIVDYISERNFAGAEKLQLLFEECAERLPGHPFAHRPGRIAGTREAVVHPNYILVYRVGADTVEVVNVPHTRREYPPN
jgi:toxin ParE1/3/4